MDEVNNLTTGAVPPDDGLIRYFWCENCEAHTVSADRFMQPFRFCYSCMMTWAQNEMLRDGHVRRDENWQTRKARTAP